MEIFREKNQCCGCTACQNICPKNAISMVADDEGFLYPSIDNSLCIDCGLCKKACAFQNGYTENHSQITYAVKHKDYNTRMTSRSGGVFIAISDYILNKGGSVYGASFDDDFSIHHTRATNATQRDKFKGSKYVQSAMENTFANIEKDLKDGMYVLFSGTGCQVGGLTKYLETKKCDTKKLYTCDIICHGVPSPLIWKDYLDYTQKLYGGKIEEFQFRDKSIGWSQHKESFVIDGQKHMTNTFAYLFNGNQIYRPSCFSCKYSNIDRPADFTLGDFWGINRILPDFTDNKGVSLLLINSEKGKELFDICKDNTDYVETEFEKSLQPNPNLFNPTKMPKDREEFWKIYHQKGFDSARKKFYAKRKRYMIRLRLLAKFKRLIGK